MPSATGCKTPASISADLYGELDLAPWLQEHFDKALLDPPRSGALQVLDLLAQAGGPPSGLCVLLSFHPGAGCRSAGQRSGIPAVGGRRNGHVSPHRPRGVHGGV